MGVSRRSRGWSFDMINSVLGLQWGCRSKRKSLFFYEKDCVTNHLNIKEYLKSVR
jgi:hypothetical protein